MRSNLFSLGMCSAVAAVAVAGSANAAVVSIFDFTTGVSANSSGSVNGSNPFNGWDTTSAIKATTASATPFGGAITMANEAWQGGLAAESKFFLSASTPVNLSGTTAIVFNVTAYSGKATNWNLMVMDSNYNWADFFLNNTSGSGVKSFDTTDTTYVGVGFDWSKVETVGLVATSTGSRGSRLASSFTFNGMDAVGVVPAPGALALLGAAGLVGARRRRD